MRVQGLVICRTGFGVYELFKVPLGALKSFPRQFGVLGPRRLTYNYRSKSCMPKGRRQTHDSDPVLRVVLLQRSFYESIFQAPERSLFVWCLFVERSPVHPRHCVGAGRNTRKPP